MREFNEEDLRLQRCKQHELGCMWEDRWGSFDFWNERCIAEQVGKSKDFVPDDQLTYSNEERQDKLMLLFSKILKMFNDDPSLALDSGAQLNKFIELASKMAESSRPRRTSSMYDKADLKNLPYTALIELLMENVMPDIPEHKREDFLNLTTELIGKTFHEFTLMRSQLAAINLAYGM